MKNRSMLYQAYYLAALSDNLTTFLNHCSLCVLHFYRRFYGLGYR